MKISKIISLLIPLLVTVQVDPPTEQQELEVMDTASMAYRHRFHDNGLFSRKHKREKEFESETDDDEKIWAKISNMENEQRKHSSEIDK